MFEIAIIVALVIIIVVISLLVQNLTHNKFRLSEHKSEFIGFMTFFILSLIAIFLFDALYIVPMRNAEILEMLGQ